MPATPQLEFKLTDFAITNQVLRFSFMGQADITYELQATGDFALWESLLTTNCPRQQQIEFKIPYSAVVPKRFFRLVQQAEEP